MTPTVRVATADDAEAVAAVSVEAYRADGYLDAVGADELEADLRDGARRVEEATVLVVEQDSAVVGTVTLAAAGTRYAETAQEGELEIRMLAVVPAARRQGVAGVLMAAAVAHARDIGAGRISLSSEASHHAVHRFYERLGYGRQPERDWQPGGVDLLCFTRDVDDGD